MGSTLVRPAPRLWRFTKVSVANLQPDAVAIFPAKVTDSSSRNSPPKKSIEFELEESAL